MNNSVSIHHMLKFIHYKNSIWRWQIWVSIHHMLKFIWIQTWGWWNCFCVSIHHMLKFIITVYWWNIKTRTFQYITCWSSSDISNQWTEEQSGFQYITCWSSSNKWNKYWRMIKRFQYITCWSSSVLKLDTNLQHLCFNTSHVEVHLTRIRKY